MGGIPGKITDEQWRAGVAKSAAKVRRTRAWFSDELIKIYEGKQCTSTQLRALCRFADNKGWYGPAKKRSAVAGGIMNERGELVDSSKRKPVVSEDVLKRMLEREETKPH